MLYRSNLQVSVYRLCELTVDTAAGHAVYVSAGNKTPHTPSRELFSAPKSSCCLLSYLTPNLKWSLLNWGISFSLFSLFICVLNYCLRFHSENLLADCLQGCFVVTCTLCAFISLVWLREQIVHGGAPQWLEQHQPPPANAAGQGHEVLYAFCAFLQAFSIWKPLFCTQIMTE